VAAAIITVALIFATVFVPLVVLWPVVIGCGCVAILGLVAFAIARGMAGKRSSRKKDFSAKDGIGKEMHQPYAFRTFKRGPVFLKDITEAEFIVLRDALVGFGFAISSKYSFKTFAENPNVIANLLIGHNLPEEIDRKLAEKILNVLGALPIDMLLFSFNKGALGYEFFARCNDHDIRVQILKLLKDRLLPEEAMLLLIDGGRNTEAYNLFQQARQKMESNIVLDMAKNRFVADGDVDQDVSLTISNYLGELARLLCGITTSNKPRVSAIPNFAQ
jgi:hypothetical protein